MNNRYYVVVFFLFPWLACAYEQPTHIELSKSAVKNSKVATDSTLLSDLGLQSYLSNETFQNPDTPNDHNNKKTIFDLIWQGANFEDNFPRSLAHFYDPINDKGLGTSNKSPDWALEDIGDVNSGVDGPQDYSYKDAMEYFYKALTLQTEQDRDSSWGKTFQALGQVIHHVEDMAQPEHVRNDDHCDNLLCIALGRYDPSWYEEYTNSDKAKPHVTSLLNSNSYPIPAFSTAREFWTTRAADAATVSRRGMADFTNRNFVSEDTNFDYDADGLLRTTDYQFPEPVQIVSRNIADADVMGTDGSALCTKLKSPASNFAPGNCYIDFVSTHVIGVVAGENPVNERASSYSVFNKYLKDYDLTVGVPGENGQEFAHGLFTLNALNYDAAHEYLIPRAVAYSAGLINHFFRGKLQISLPDAGVYGFLDQSTVTGINPETGFQGFNKIKLKVANITPPLPGDTTPEVMNNGTLQAVMKFHRNTCWQDNLYGYPPAVTIAVTTDGSQCQSVQEEIVTSNTRTISISQITSFRYGV